MKEIIFYQHINGKIPVQNWLKELDVSYRKRVFDRLQRVEQDENFGDFKILNDKISELRFNFGSGYRIYFAEIDNVIILLLNAGDKKLQNKDIEKALEYYEIWRQNNG